MAWPPPNYPLRTDWPEPSGSDPPHASDYNHLNQTANEVVAEVIDVVTNQLPAKQSVSAKGAANGYAPLGADARVPAAYLPSGVGGGSIDTFDFWENWANNSNGAPTTAESGQTYTATTAGASGAALTVVSGKLTNTYSTGTSAAAGYLSIPLGNPCVYMEGEFQFNGTGTDGATVAACLFESAPPAGNGGVGSQRAAVHWIWTPAYSAMQTADTSLPGAVTNIDVQVYTTPSGVAQKFACAIDRANNRVVVVYPNGHIAVLTDTAHSYFQTVPGNYPTQEILYTTPNSDKRAEWHAFRASAVIGGDNIEYASKYDQLIAIGKVIAAGGSVGSYVTYAPPPTGVEATDTAAIQAAHDALPSRGGKIILQEGVYMLSATGVTFTKQTHLIGAGRDMTVIGMNSTNGTAITCNVDGCILEHFSMSNVNFGTQTGGAGIRMQKAAESRIRDVWLYNFYDNISVEQGYYWSIINCHIYSPWRYGIRVQSTVSNDSGDMNIIDCWFDQLNVTRNATSALRWETGSGLRVLGCKFNGSNSPYRFATHIDIAFDAVTTAIQNSADIFIQNNSIENPGTTGVKIARAAGAYALYEILVQDNEFMACPTGISIGQSIEDFIISGNVMLNSGGSTVGVDLLSGSGAGTIGPNHFNGITTPVQIGSGASKNLVVNRQDIVGDGLVVTNAVLGTSGVPCVDVNYQRPIDFTVNATPSALWTFGVPNLTAGRIKTNAGGTYNAAAGFYAELDFTYTVNGSGVVTFTDRTTVPDGDTNPVISHSSTANTIVVKLATTGGNNITNGKAEVYASGLFSQIKRGA
jgi:hypothetical protein